MAFNEQLAQRIRNILSDNPSLIEKKMFGGVGFLLFGNMICGVNQGDLIVRVGPDKHAEALSQPYTRVFDITGKPMSGWVLVSAEGCNSNEKLQKWVLLALDYVQTLPPK
jgi:TfoX/Sxy family transcriptional regulator of competence genes